MFRGGGSLVENKKVAWFIGCLVSWFLKAIAPIFKMFKNFNCMFSGIYSSHVQAFQEFPFHVFWKRLIPYSRFSKIYQRDLRECSGPVCSNISNMLEFQTSGFPKVIFSENDQGIFLDLFGVSWCLQRYIILVLGVMATPRNPKTIKMMSFRVFLK